MQRRLGTLTAQAAAAKQAADACILCSEAAMREVAAEVNHSLMQDIADCDLRRQQQQAQQAQQQGGSMGDGTLWTCSPWLQLQLVKAL